MIQKNITIVILVVLLSLSLASAWCFKGFSKNNYNGKYYEYFSRSKIDKTGCYNLNEGVAGNLNSFKYWGSYCTVTLFSDIACKGSNLGHSLASWRKSNVSEKASKAKSIGITGSLCHFDVAWCDMENVNSDNQTEPTLTGGCITLPTDMPADVCENPPVLENSTTLTPTNYTPGQNTTYTLTTTKPFVGFHIVLVDDSKGRVVYLPGLSSNDNSNDTSNDSPNNSTNDTSNGSTNNSTNDTSNPKNDTSNDSPNNSTNDTSNPKNDTSNDSTNNSTNDTSNPKNDTSNPKNDTIIPDLSSNNSSTNESLITTLQVCGNPPVDSLTNSYPLNETSISTISFNIQGPEIPSNNVTLRVVIFYEMTEKSNCEWGVYNITLTKSSAQSNPGNSTNPDGPVITDDNSDD